MWKKPLFIAYLSLLCGVLSSGLAWSATDFDLKDMTGKHHHLSAYKGKWVMVNYWATWCPPCLEEVPDLVALYDSRKNKDVMVIGVALDYESAKSVSEYVDDMLMSYPIVLGDDEVVNQIGHADVLPTTFIYNPSGQLVKTKHGKVTKQYLESLIKDAAKK
jgi:thiol-disulfide isomerase/thioredoxin